MKVKVNVSKPYAKPGLVVWPARGLEVEPALARELVEKHGEHTELVDQLPALAADESDDDPEIA